MGSTSSERISLSASAQKLDVDHRISLGVYFRMADDFLKQADKHREEKNVVDLYISLLRFSSLVSETIPCHQDYRASDEPEKVSLKKKLLNALNELEELKPAVEEMLNENRNAHQNPARSRNLQRATSSIRINIGKSNCFPEKRTIFRPLSRPKQECEHDSPFGLPCNQKETKKVLCAVIAEGINAGEVKKLQDAGIYTCNGFMLHTKKKLTGIKGLSEAKVDTICEAFEKIVVGTILHNLKCSSKIVCTASDQTERVSPKKKLLHAPSELEEYLKPAVKQMLNEKRIAYQNHLQQVGAPSSHVRNNIGNSSSFLEKHAIFHPFSHPKQEFEYRSPFDLPTQEGKIETGIEHLPRDEHDWQQLQWFSNACKGIQEPTAPPAEEDLELVMAINASIQSALQERLPIHETSASSSSTTSMDSGDWSGHESGPGRDSTLHTENYDISTIQTTATSDSIPSSPTTTSSSSSSCVICWDGPVEGAFIPCGHMAGCMPCLNEIKAKNWDCPVCRGKVDQVIRLYSV